MLLREKRNEKYYKRYDWSKWSYRNEKALVKIEQNMKQFHESLIE